ncbi:MAG: hemin uptake protein HemP [Planctomycetaceae bacterium]|nr:hemin uptake protein HemP [Planctomycetaceae bacterium]
MAESENTRQSAEEARSSSNPTQRSSKQIESSELFAGRTEIEILHDGETYRLRKTKAGKLILTK